MRARCPHDSGRDARATADQDRSRGKAQGRAASLIQDHAPPPDDWKDPRERFMIAGAAQNPIRSAGVPPAVTGASRSRKGKSSRGGERTKQSLGAGRMPAAQRARRPRYGGRRKAQGRAASPVQDHPPPPDDGQDSRERLTIAGAAQNLVRNAGVPPAVPGASRSRKGKGSRGADGRSRTWVAGKMPALRRPKKNARPRCKPYSRPCSTT